MLVGIISDTHGWFHVALPDVFAGVDLILHAGDVGSEAVLDELESLAPVMGVRGNMDTSDLGGRLPPIVNVRLEATRALMVHRSRDLPRPLPAGVGIVVTGHTHAASVERDADGVLRVNPGSATRSQPRTVALLDVENGETSARIVSLD